MNPWRVKLNVEQYFPMVLFVLLIMVWSNFLVEALKETSKA